MKKRYAILSCAILLTLFQSQAHAQLIYLVDGSKTGNTTATGVGAVDAAAWENAVGSLRAAIAASNAGDEIWVRAGTYETISYEPFKLKEGVRYYGNFTGNETQVSQRDLQAESSVTHIVGQEWGTFVGRDLTNATVLDGFKMSRNQNTPEGIGFLLENASPIIRNCLFEQLSSSMSESGVKVENGSPVIDNCVFRSNMATSDGLLNLSGTSPTISNSTFEWNNGVVVSSNGSAPIYTNCVFNHNNGSPIESSNNSYSIIRGCEFFNNLNTAVSGLQSSTTLYSCIIRGNISETSPGGIYGSFSSTFTLFDCLIENNTSSLDEGGGIASFGTLHLSNCVITGNRAPQGLGGGIFWNKGNDSENMSLINCVISRNFAGSAGGIFGAQLIKNTIIWDNSARLSDSNALFIDAPQVVNSIIENGYEGEGRIAVNPQFFNPYIPTGEDGIFGTADDGFRLQSCSPAIDAGTNEGITATTDVSGAPRIFNSIIDIGAFELQSLVQAETLLAANREFSSKTIRGTENTVFNVDGSECKAVIGLKPSGSEPVAGEVTAKVWIETSQPSQFVKRHYEITPAANAKSATARVTLYATDAEFNAFNTQSSAPTMLLPLSTDSEQLRATRIANLHIEKRSGSSDDYTGLPDSYEGAGVNIDPDDKSITWNAAAKRWEITFDVTGFSGFFIKTQSSALPVHWVSVNASLNVESQPVITWKVQETSVASYSIQKSLDARRYEVIGKLEGAGDGMHEYSFNEALPLTGRAYYRIDQTDIDGTTTYSRIVTLSSEAKADPSSVYPVPARKDVYLIVKKAVKEEETLTLTDLSGRSLKVQKLQTGTNKIDISKLQMGIYLIRTTGGEVLKIIKE